MKETKTKLSFSEMTTILGKAFKVNLKTKGRMSVFVGIIGFGMAYVPVISSSEQKKNELDEYIITMNRWVNEFSTLSDNVKRTGFQISINDANYKYIGWCNSYNIDEECNYSKTGKRRAVGIDIPENCRRGKGLGFSALCLFIDYLLSNGEMNIYTQTWSGNVHMIGLAHKLGFEKCDIKKSTRNVRGKKYDALTFRLNINKFKVLTGS